MLSSPPEHRPKALALGENVLIELCPDSRKKQTIVSMKIRGRLGYDFFLYIDIVLITRHDAGG